MPKLPRKFRGKDAVKILKKLGYEIYNLQGSHCTMIKTDCNPPKIITVPLHKKGLKPGTLTAIITKTGLSASEFFSYK